MSNGLSNKTKRCIMIFVIMLNSFGLGCGQEEYIKLPYSIEYAYSNNDVIDIVCGNKVYNERNIEDFMDSVKKGEKGKIRITKYNDMDYNIDWNEPTQIYDLSYDGKYINLTIFNTHTVKTNDKSTKIIEAGTFYRGNKMTKNITDLDVQYSFNNKKYKKFCILSILKNGWIPEKQQKYLDSIGSMK